MSGVEAGGQQLQIIVKLISGELVYSEDLGQVPGEILKVVEEVVATPATAGAYLSIPKKGRSKIIVPRDQIRYVWVKDADEFTPEDVNVD